MDYRFCPSVVLEGLPYWDLPTVAQDSDATIEVPIFWEDTDGGAAIDLAFYPAWPSFPTGDLNAVLPLDSQLAPQLQLLSRVTTTPFVVNPSLESLQHHSLPKETNLLSLPNETSNSSAGRVRKILPRYSKPTSPSAPKPIKLSPRQRNLIAGREARKKRRREEDRLKEVIRSMMEKRDKMLDEEKELRGELQALRSQMRMHENCGPPCHNLQEYLENTQGWDYQVSQLSSCGLALVAEGRRQVLYYPRA